MFISCGRLSVAVAILVVILTNNVFGFSHDLRNALSCPSVTICKCSIGAYYEIACPNRINTSITLRVEPQRLTNRVEIECNSEDANIFELLPKWNIGDSNIVKFDGCPFASNTSVQHIFERLGIENVHNLIFFAHATSVSSNQVNLPQNLFEHLQNVTSLDLRSDKMLLPSHIFHSLGELEFLQISSTNLSNKSDGIYQHLDKLKRLILWNNNLRNLSKDFFVDVSGVLDLEISSNDIDELPIEIFKHLRFVESINLNSNRLNELPPQLFDKNRALQKVRISNNHLKLNTLPNELFARLPRIDAVWINDCNLVILPNNLFAESFNLRNISLAYNNLIELPATIFHDQRNLLSLDLSYNDLTFLDDNLFKETNQLVVFRLSHNRLSNISMHLISGLGHLQEIYLDSNNLHTIHMTALDGTGLQVLHLQNNFLDFRNIEDDLEMDVEKISPFQNLIKLQVLNMRNNSIKTFLHDWHTVNVALTELDLSHNQIEMINFGSIFNIWIDNIRINVSHNQITKMFTSKHIAFNPNQSNVIWILNHNPLRCDCVVIHFAMQLRKQINGLQNATTIFITDELKCLEPERFVNQQLQNVPLAQLTCPLDKKNVSAKKCPTKCECFVRTIDHTAIFNCSNAHLTKIPALPDIQSLGLQHYELHIENNNISTLSMANTTGYKSVNRIYAKNNTLEIILPEHLPNDLYDLDLSANKLKRINPDVLLKLSHMQNLQNVSFSWNPWICDCVAYQLMNFIQTHFTKIVGINEITCDNDKSQTLISQNGLCPIDITTIFMLLIAGIFALMLFTTIVYYKNQQEIMVWIFAHHAFSWLFNDKTKSNDTTKKYDVFVLCSMLDEDFVIGNVLPQLENGRNALKVCSNVREIKSGADVPKQIAKFVDISKQTIIVLTPNFIDCFSNQKQYDAKAVYPETQIDVWGLLGFRVAHQNTLEEKRTRVIIITKGDIGSFKQYQPELKAYLKTNIYLRWDEARFFDKLRLAIAHPKFFEPKNQHSIEIEQN